MLNTMTLERYSENGLSTPHRPYNLLPGALVPISTGAGGRAEVRWRLTGSSVICSSSHPLGAGVFFIQKKICSICPHIDYRGLSYITSPKMSLHPLALRDSIEPGSFPVSIFRTLTTWSGFIKAMSGRLLSTPCWGSLNVW